MLIGDFPAGHVTNWSAFDNSPVAGCDAVDTGIEGGLHSYEMLIYNTLIHPL